MIFNTRVPVHIKTSLDLVTYLTSRFTYYTREQWIEKIIDGSVTVDSNRVTDCCTVTGGTVISYDAGEFDEPAANLDYKVIYEDEWLLGIDKPGNLLVHRAGKSFRNNLVYHLREIHVPPYPDAHPAHRLDRDTSGVVIVAKSTECRALLGDGFLEKEMKKVYVAIVKGMPDLKNRVIDIPIGKDLNSSISYKFIADPKGKDAVTHIIDATPVGKSHALVILSPVTGRTHQLRVHCAAIGHPIVGDKLYDMDEEVYKQWRDNPSLLNSKLVFYRHALHCQSITFKHPLAGTDLTIAAPLPKDMAELIEKLQSE
jgi:RluA family pseudouridine synthase